VNDEKTPDSWETQSELDIKGLVRGLSSGNKDIRRRAAAALKAMGGAQALPALKVAFAEEEDAQTRHSIAIAIEMLTHEAQKQGVSPDKMGGQLAESKVDTLLRMLQSNDADQVIEAARKLGELVEKRAVTSLVLLFNDQKRSIHVRLAVAEALLKLESAPVEVALLANLRHPEWQIRRNGAAILGQLKAEWAIQPLARGLKDPHPVVRRTALAALKHIGTPESRKAVAQNSPNSNVQHSVSNTKQTTASGLDIKHPGQQKSDDENDSGMLRKHLNHNEESRAKRVTSPLVDKSVPSKAKIEATQPIGKGLLDKLDSLVADETLDTVVDGTPDTVTDETPDTITDETPDTVTDEVADTVTDKAPDTVADETPDKTTDEVTDETPDTVTDKVADDN
jgi:HEAT repeat protein/PBS lyase HEAT-like repeat-containing protein